MFFKKKAGLFFILSVGQLYACQMGTDISCITFSCEQAKWDIAGSGLYLQPSNGSVSQLSLGKTGTNQTTVFGAEANWSWGFNLEVGYENHVGNDIKLNWSHFREEVSNDLNNFSVNNIYMVQSFFTDAGRYKNLNISGGFFNINPAWDQVNLEFAKRLHIGVFDRMRVHAGVNYSRIDNSGNYQLTYSATDIWNHQEQNVLSNTFSAFYNGFGPRLGTDLEHVLSNGYIAYGELAISALAGMSKTNSNFNDILTIAGSKTPYSGIFFLSRPRVVPEVDARLGVKFEYLRPSGHLFANIGWLWTNYFGVIDGNEQNFGIQGLNLSLKWKANMH